MAQTLIAPRPALQSPPEVNRGNSASVLVAADLPAPVARKALALTDASGHRAFVWRQDGAWRVTCADPRLRRRIRRAFRRPLWVREDVLGPDGLPGSTLVQVQPDDARYASQVFWHWHQLPLQGVDVKIVPYTDGQAIAGLLA